MKIPNQGLHRSAPHGAPVAVHNHMAEESVEADSGHLDIIRVAGPSASLESLTPGLLESSILVDCR
jgi:hypothetical protein